MSTTTTDTARFAGHTPGPWHVFQDVDPEACPRQWAIYGDVDGATKIASVESFRAEIDADDTESDINAELLAAAPTLLAARDELAAQVAMMRGTLRATGTALLPGANDADREAAFELALAALAATAPKEVSP